MTLGHSRSHATNLIGNIWTLALTMFLLLGCSIQITTAKEQGLQSAEANRPGIQPANGTDCPPTHSIKGNFTTHSGERCIYHMEGQRFYKKTKPERCYATAKDAILDGCRASKV